MRLTYSDTVLEKVDAEIDNAMLEGKNIEFMSLHAGEFAQLCVSKNIHIPENPFRLFLKDRLPDSIKHRGVVVKLNRTHFK